MNISLDSTSNFASLDDEQASSPSIMKSVSPLTRRSRTLRSLVSNPIPSKPSDASLTRVPLQRSYAQCCTPEYSGKAAAAAAAAAEAVVPARRPCPSPSTLSPADQFICDYIIAVNIY